MNTRQENLRREETYFLKIISLNASSLYSIFPIFRMYTTNIDTNFYVIIEGPVSVTQNDKAVPLC